MNPAKSDVESTGRADVHNVREVASLVIEARPAAVWPDWSEVWQSRALLWMFVRRDLAVQYRQTLIGIAWAVFRPLTTIIIFSLVFGLLGRFPRGPYPYHVFLFSAVLIQQYFSRSVNDISGGLVNKKVLLTQIYFPRVLVPLTSIVVGLVDLVIGMMVFGVILLVSGIAPTIRIIWLFPFLLLAMVTAFGVGCIFAAIDVRRRDLRVVLPNIMTMWMYATPVIYPLASVPLPYQMIFGINPMATVVEGFRWAILPQWPHPPIVNVVISTLVAALMFIVGIWRFNHVEKTMADFA